MPGDAPHGYGVLMDEDFNKLRMISKRLVNADFQQPWQWKVEIDGLPENLLNVRNGVSTFDLLAKDITYSPIEFETEAIKAGSVTLTFPSGTQPVIITMTMRDLEDERLKKWFKGWAKGEGKIPGVANPDGTFNLPFGHNGYLRELRRISLVDSEDIQKWMVFPQKLGEITESVESPGFLEFPISFIQFKSWS